MQQNHTPFKLSRYAALLVLIVLFISVKQSRASHAAGADITYRWLGGLTYEVTATFYRDCAGIDAPTSMTLNYSSSACGFYSSSTTLFPISGTGNEITYPCPTSATTCTNGTQPGIQQWIYQGTITLPFACTDWNFNFEVAARNCAITTIVKPSPCNSTSSPGNLYVEATLNNLTAPNNSSPTFSSLPVAFVCIGQDYFYNNGSFDANGDSLVYSFVTPKTDGFGGVVTFLPGYDYAHFITSSPATSINSINGNVFMHPTASEVGIFAVLVQEYRNGVLIGSVIRDMQVYTVQCNNNLPTASGINGTIRFSTFVCAGSTLCFDIFSNDADATQTVTMSWNSAINGATFTISGSPHPTGHFCWTPTAGDVRSVPYTFIVTVRDNACPRNGLQIFSYEVFVEDVQAIASAGNVNCSGGNNGVASVTATSGTGPFTYLWTPGNATTQTITGLSTGTYSVLVTSAHSCSTTQTVNVTNPPPLVATETHQDVTCIGGSDGSATISVSGAQGPLTYTWTPNVSSTNTASGLPAGSYSVSISDGTCSTQISFTLTYLHPLPIVNLGPDSSVCTGTAVTLDAGSFAAYQWSTGNTTQTITVTSAGTFSVLVTDAFGCQNSDTINVSYRTCGGAGNCTFTQGFWGNRGGKACDSLSKLSLYNNLLTPPLVIGAGSRIITFSAGDALCIIAKLPANTGPKALPIGNVTCATATAPRYLTKVGRFNNVLLGQTLTLGLNMRFSANLSSIVLASSITTYATDGKCGIGNPVSGSGMTFHLPQSVLTYLGPTATVYDLYVLANNALGGVYVPTNLNDPTLSAINQAVDAINNGFDGCRTTVSPRLKAIANGSGISVYPNPAKEALNVAIEGIADDVTVELQLSDALGNKVFSQSEKGNYNYLGTIDIRQIANGVYFLKVQYGDITKTIKVLKD